MKPNKNFILIPIMLFSVMCFLGCNADNSSSSAMTENASSLSGSASIYDTASDTSITTGTTTEITTAIDAVTTVQTTVSDVYTTTTTITTVAQEGVILPEKTEYCGIDVSRWQGSVDFESVKASGVEIVYIKAGDNLNTDICFEKNAENAKNAGLATGFYFYVTAGNTEQARAQAEYFADLLNTVEYQCRPAVDFEAFGSLSVESINQIALEFAQTVEEETGITPIFYTDADNADIWCEELTKYPLWIADYDADPPYFIGKWSEYAGFQYSCTGVVDGITENVVDLDIYTADVLF